MSVPAAMRAAVYRRNDDVRIEEMPVPRPGPGEFLMRTRASGICGSDVMEWYRAKRAPCVLGHEVAGEVAELGPGVEGWRKGDRVFVSHHVPCNRCRHCLRGDHTACRTLHSTNFDPGGFAEFIRVPPINVQVGAFKLPDEVSDEEGVFIEPLGCAVRGQRAVGMEPGMSVLVVGSGIAGLLHIQLAAALGAGRIFAADIHPYRAGAARRFGAEALPAGEGLPAALREANEGRLADRVLLCAGAPAAVEASLRCAAEAGAVLLFAPPAPGRDYLLPLHELWGQQVALVSTYGAAPLDLAQALDLIRARRVNVRDMVTHRLPLEEAQEGFRLVAEAGESIKVILKP
jgi:L-iditol 2-dehydrogenase